MNEVKIRFLRNDIFHFSNFPVAGYSAVTPHSVARQHFFKLEYAQLVSQAFKADHEAAEHFVMTSFEARKNFMQISWLHIECAAS